MRKQEYLPDGRPVFRNRGGPPVAMNLDGTLEPAELPAPLPPLEGNPLFAVVGGKSYALTPEGMVGPQIPFSDEPLMMFHNGEIVFVDPPGGES